MKGSTWPVKKTGWLVGNIYHNVPSLQTQNMIQKLRTPFYMCKRIITFDYVLFTSQKDRLLECLQHLSLPSLEF